MVLRAVWNAINAPKPLDKAAILREGGADMVSQSALAANPDALLATAATGGFE